MESIVKLENVQKEFLIPEKTLCKGIWRRIKSVFYRKWKKIKVLHNLNLNINKGEFVGYIGPNGAGKSTTIKILSGVLTPSNGKVNILGFNPITQRYNYTYHIGVVFGHRSLLEYDIPVIESFLMYKDIYELKDEQYNERMKLFSKLLNIDKYLHIQVRKLSLGERMRCEIAASLLHKPKILFLDEPTIGLDSLAKQEIRNFLSKMNTDEKVTIILTTHDMDDIEALCKRIIIIDNGRIIYDGDLSTLKKKFIRHKTIELELEFIKNQGKWDSIVKKIEIVNHSGAFWNLKVDIRRHDASYIVKQIMDCAEVIDLNIHEPRLEHIIKEIYTKGKT